MKHRVKLLRDADGPFICIPKEFFPQSEDVIIQKEGDRLIIQPVPQETDVLHPRDETLVEPEDLPARNG